MDRLRSTLIAAAVLASWGVLQSLLMTNEFASATPTTRLRTPLTGLVGAIGFGLNVATFGALGLLISRSGGSARQAAGSGALAGAIASGVSAIVTVVVFREPLRTLLASYGLSPAASDGVLLVGLGVGALLTAGLGALVAWLSARVFRTSETKDR